MSTKVVHIKGAKVGGGNPIVIQSMTNTDTADYKATAQQIIELADAGSEIVRITVNNPEAAAAVPEIRVLLDEAGYKDLPLVGDFHYNGHTLLEDFPQMAQDLDKYRINPGNVGYECDFSKICKIAASLGKAVRIGINWGSLDQDLLTEMMDANTDKSDREVIIDAMVESALRSVKLAEKEGLTDIVLSVKMSELPDMVKAYELLHSKNTGYPLHLGLTEAGSGSKGLISSSAALSILIHQGIGDTIRISLTPKPGESRIKEVEACKQLLQSLGRRQFSPQVTSCPGCGRTGSTFFQELTEIVEKHLATNHPTLKNLKVAVMGCVVNGPGESKHADIGISIPGKMEKPIAPVYIAGKLHKTLTGENIPEQFLKIVDDYVAGIN